MSFINPENLQNLPDGFWEENEDNESPIFQDQEEMQHYRQVLASFISYYNDSMNDLNKIKTFYDQLPMNQIKLLKYSFADKYTYIQQCIESNQQFYNAVINDQQMFFQDEHIQNANFIIEPINKSKVIGLLEQIVREWSKEGQGARDNSFGIALNSLQQYFPNQQGVKILNPGCGLGRLCLEIAQLGYDVQGIEFSYHMALISEFFMNKSPLTQKYTIFPWIHSFHNTEYFQDMVSPVQVPDIDYAQISNETNFSISTGDFVEIGKKQPSYYDCVVTSYFIDTGKNILDYLEVIHGALKTNGIWINIGPLTYHFTGVQGEISIELSLEEVYYAAEQIGFEILEQEKVEFEKWYIIRYFSWLAKLINLYNKMNQVELLQPRNTLKTIMDEDDEEQLLFYQERLKKNVPYYNWDLENEFANSSQIYKSYNAKKRNLVLISPSSDDCYFNFDDMDIDIKEQVENQNFKEYAKAVVQVSNFFFFKTGDYKKRLRFSNDLTQSLTYLDGEIHSVGLKVFRIIKKICQDRERKYLPHRKIRKLIEILLNNPVEVKDECLLQLIKQTTKNPYLAKNFNEWKLMAIITSFVSPSENFIYVFIKYMETIHDTTLDDDIKQWSKYVVKRVLQTDQNSERSVLPCFLELKSIEEKKKIPIEVYYPNGSSEFFFFESYSTVEELKDKVIEKHNFNKQKKQYFGIYEYCSKENVSEENYIDDNIKILDIIGSWANEIDFLKYKNDTDEIQIKYRLYFKIRYYFETDNVQEQVLQYQQCEYQFMRNRFNMQYEDWKKLCALRFRICFGEPNQIVEDHLVLNFQNEVPNIDESQFEEQQKQIIKDQVIKCYKEQEGDFLSLIKQFLDICRQQHLFFAQIFPAKFLVRADQEKIDQNPFNFPDILNIGITQENVFILDESFVNLKTFTYNQLMKWGFSSKQFILIVENTQEENEKNKKDIKISFKTKMASDIVHTLNSFINIKIGKDPQANQLIVNENVTREIYENKFYKKVNIFKKSKMHLEGIPNVENAKDQEIEIVDN